jgi:recombination protein RecT
MATNLETRLAEQKRRADAGEALDRVGDPTSVMGFLTNPKTKAQVARLLGDEEMAERFLRIGLTEVRRITGTPGKRNGLADCSMESFAGALMQCAMLKLEPGPPLGLAWILPYETSYKDGNTWKKRMDAQFQLGYPGIIQLAHRSGQLADIAAHEVCEGDEFGFDYLSGEKHHRPSYKGARGEAYGVYCFAKYANGGEHFNYMTVEQVRAHAERFSKAYQYDLKRIADGGRGNSPWSTDFVPMMRKTAIKQSRPYLPASADFVLGLRADERTMRVDWEKNRVGIDDDALDIVLAPPTMAGELTEGEPGAAEAQQPAEGASEQAESLPGIKS